MNKNEIKALKEYRNCKSMELFDKDECKLNIEEQIKLDKYIHDLANPQWKPVVIENHKTSYQISNTGILLNKNSRRVHPTVNRKGYEQITIVYTKGKKITTSIHRLVAIAFIHNPENKPQVNHTNGKKNINWDGNLEWVTAKENINHAHVNGLVVADIGEDANSSIYNDAQIHEVCKLLETCKFINTEIAEMTKVGPSTVSKIKCNKGWLHISSQYNIPDPIKNAVGEVAASSIYKEKDIHKVCKLLEKNIKMSEIAKQINVGYDTIYRIKKGLNWRNVSFQYNIPGLSSKPDATNFCNLEQCSTTIGQL